MNPTTTKTQKFATCKTAAYGNHNFNKPLKLIYIKQNQYAGILINGTTHKLNWADFTQNFTTT